MTKVKNGVVKRGSVSKMIGKVNALFVKEGKHRKRLRYLVKTAFKLALAAFETEVVQIWEA